VTARRQSHSKCGRVGLGRKFQLAALERSYSYRHAYIAYKTHNLFLPIITLINAYYTRNHTIIIIHECVVMPSIFWVFAHSVPPHTTLRQSLQVLKITRPVA